MDDVASSKYRLSLLGCLELTGPTGPVELPSKKLACLLAYLACTAPQPQPREKLAALLWGSHFDIQARQNLRQALFRLRRVLGQDVLPSDEEEVSLAPGDAARLEALIREGSRDSLAAAADLYKGRLLADLTVTVAAWAEWVAGEQRRLEGFALDAMIWLGELERKSGMHNLALAAASRAISINNLREDAHRVAIRALAAAGRRADALKHYEDLAKQLKSELDVEPDALTKALALELRNSQSTAAPLAERVALPSEVADLPPLSDRPSIAVLPFANMSGDPEQEYFVRNRAASVYVVCSESDKAIAQCEAASRMNPLDSKKAATGTFSTLSCALYLARRYEESIRAGRRALVLTPQSNIARKYVAISLAQLGRTDEARVEIAELLKHQPGASLAAFQQRAFRHKWMQELYLEGLRKTGLREE
jgi:DNA-binding SARP family transcriptional activator